MTLTKEYIDTLTLEEKEDLEEQLLDQGMDIVFIKYFLYDLDYDDVKDLENEQI